MNARKRRRHFLSSLLVMVLIGLFCLGPLFWIAITSVKVPGTEFRTPLEYLPNDPTLASYEKVFTPSFAIQRAILNSVLVSTGAMVGTILLSGFAA